MFLILRTFLLVSSENYWNEVFSECEYKSLAYILAIITILTTMAPHKKPWRKLIQISETKRNIQEDTEVSTRDKEMFKMMLIEMERCSVTKEQSVQPYLSSFSTGRLVLLYVSTTGCLDEKTSSSSPPVSSPPSRNSALQWIESAGFEALKIKTK